MEPQPAPARHPEPQPEPGPRPGEEAAAAGAREPAPEPTSRSAPERVAVIACGALAREIRTLVARHGWDHLALRCLPADLHLRPERIVPAVEAALSGPLSRGERAFVAYADCGTGGRLRALCDRLGVEMLAGAHCYAVFEGPAAFAAREETTAFYLTDFLARQFDAFVWRPLGLDRHPELRDAYFGRYTTLVHQAQADDPALEALGRAHAARLGLAYERRLTGHGDLSPALAALR